MIIGFTGTRKGMSWQQRDQLRLMLGQLKTPHLGVNIFVHGGALGADDDAANIACLEGYAERVHHAGEYPLERNHKIVAECEVLIAAPEKDEEVLRSGTWATVRYARRAGKPVVMLSRGLGR